MIKRLKKGKLVLSRETLTHLETVVGGTNTGAGTTCDVTCNTTLCTLPGYGCGSGDPCAPTGGIRCYY